MGIYGIIKIVCFFGIMGILLKTITNPYNNVMTLKVLNTAQMLWGGTRQNLRIFTVGLDILSASLLE